MAGGDVRLGWYAGVRRVGLAMRPELRGGLTAKVPGVEMAAGISQQVNAGGSEASRSLEVAMREGWLNRLVSPLGWDVFFEGAVRRVLEANTGYTGAKNSGRAGFFARREEVPGLPNVVLRGSAELQSDFSEQVYFGVGLGFEHSLTGLATVLQASRSPLKGPDGTMVDTRGGIFLAGTMEPPTQMFVETMRTRPAACATSGTSSRAWTSSARATSSACGGWGRPASAACRRARRWRGWSACCWRARPRWCAWRRCWPTTWRAAVWPTRSPVGARARGTCTGPWIHRCWRARATRCSDGCAISRASSSAPAAPAGGPAALLRGAGGAAGS
jgi:hypothetical protein